MKGCAISDCAWVGDVSLFISSVCTSRCLCSPGGNEQTKSENFTNNTYFYVTVTLPSIGGASWNRGAAKVITAQSTLT